VVQVGLKRVVVAALLLGCACGGESELPGDEAIAGAVTPSPSPSRSPEQTIEPSPETELIKVPNLLGRQSANAVELIRSRDLRLNRVGYFAVTGEFAFGIKRIPSDEPAGTILRQRPTPGKRVKPGTRVTLVASAGPRPDCDPSYASACIPPYPPDLDCDDVPYSNIVVVGSDPHGFDGYDNDGRGCES
jgi:hypothetical protein